VFRRKGGKGQGRASKKGKTVRKQTALRASFGVRAVEFLPRVLPAVGLSAGAILWGLHFDYFYWGGVAAGGLLLALIFGQARRASHSAILGVDIGHSAIKVVEVTRRGGARLLRHAVIPTPPGAVADGVIREPEKVSEALTEGLAGGKFSEREAVSVMTGQTVVVQHLDFPKMRDSDLRTTIGQQIGQYVPMPSDEICYDFFRVPDPRDDVSRVLLVATQRDPVVQLAEVLRKTGLAPIKVDIEPLAAQRAVYGSVPRQERARRPARRRAARAADDEVAATAEAPRAKIIVDLGAGTSNVSIYQDEILQLQRVLRVAGDDFTRAIAIGQKVSMEEAEELKREHGLTPDSPVSWAVTSTMDNLFRELRLSLEFYHGRNREVQFEEMVLVGGNAKLKALPERLKEYLKSSLEGLIDTSSLVIRVGANPGRLKSSMGQAQLDELFPVLAVAIGLAMGEVAGVGGS